MPSPAPGHLLTITRRQVATREWPAGIASPILREVSPPLLVALLALVAFAPALFNGFVDWDDQVNFLGNPHYRGLGWSQFRWMFTTFLMGQWIPLTWMTLGLDYLLWGMNPFGYHLTNVVLHAANAALLFLVARRLLALALPALDAALLRAAGAVATALFFALHPLRAESVAWVTERRDVVSGLFSLLTVFGYLRARTADERQPRRWLAVSMGSYALAILSKATVVTLPAVLLVLDAYPLRRLTSGAGGWRVRARALAIEKAPYLALALVGGAMAVQAQRVNNFLTPLDRLPALDRIPVALYGVGFYVSKTLLPIALSPLYELPARIDAREPRFIVSALGAAALTTGFVLARRRWPAGLAAWAAYLVMLVPVSGIVHNGHQLAHDRYSYLVGLPWALLFGGAVVGVLHAGATRMVRLPLARLGAGAAALWLLGLSAMTWHQVKIWQDNDTLWRYALDADPNCSICHINLGVSLYNRKLYALAQERFETALGLRPDRVRTHGNMGLVMLATGRPAEAATHFGQVLKAYPHDTETRVNLAVSLIQLQKFPAAITELREVLRQDPDHALAQTNLASALLDTGQPAEALGYLKRAAELKPDAVQPHAGLVRTYLALGDVGAARAELEVVRTMDPNAAHALGAALIADW